MNQIKAFKETVAVARQSPWHTMKDGCSVVHLEDMLKKLLSDQSKPAPTMSPAKIGRWLGWAQAIVCCYSPLGLSMNYFKELNGRCK